MTETTKTNNSRLALKSIFSAASMNGTAAILMAYSMGTTLSTGLYAYAVTAGIYYKYNSLKKSEDTEQPKAKSRVKKLTSLFTGPSITAKILMAAAAYNFIDAGNAFLTGPAEEQSANLLRTIGWAFGFFGDNAVRRLDVSNFTKDSVFGKAKTKLSETFNALTANPTLFYNGASMAFTLSLMSKSSESMTATTDGQITLAALGLVLLGVGHAVRNTWKATQGKIPTEKINDGFMNYCSSIAKAAQSYVSFMAGAPYLGTAQGIFTASNIKLIYETRSALKERDKQPNIPPPPAP